MDYETETEYVAVVRVERVTRKVIPAGTPVPRRSATVTTEPRVARDKAEMAAFTIRSSSLPGVAQRVQAMMSAALPEAGVEGEPLKGSSDEEEDEEF